MNYLLGTGYYPATRYDAFLFARVWIENVIRNARPRPFRILVMSQRNAVFHRSRRSYPTSCRS